MEAKLPITAMIVGRNEAHLLDRCFSSISFCDEILYTDIQSTDNSKLIARRYTDKVFDSGLIPSGEYAHALMVKEARNEWVLFIDPDEYFSNELVLQIASFFPRLIESTSIGALLVPWEFYFKSKKLKGTVWGNNKKIILANKYRFSFKPITHYGRHINEGYTVHEIIRSDKFDNVLHHEWMNSYRIFIHKHMRYLKNEGKDRFNTGNRVSISQLIKTPFKEFKYSILDKKGYKDGVLGLFLSMFWAFYQSYANLNLYLIYKGVIK